jgi:single-stranded-DNA-specific exonuclease
MSIAAQRNDAQGGVRSKSGRVYKKIKLRPQRTEVAQIISSKLSVSLLVARILAARGFEPGEELKNFISPTLKHGLPAPDQLKNLRQAAQTIAGAAQDNRAIAICCDFDVDGLSGGSVVHDLFNSTGVRSRVFVPDRFVDGYGLNERTVREIAANGFGILLTIDFGTTNTNELKLAKELGLTTIVVDHHHLSGEPPPADIFINPHQEGCGFAGGIACAAGLAWYLVVALAKELKVPAVDPKEFLDLACLGTICDMVPLVGLNRVIAKRGLEALTISKRPGIRALRNVIGIKGAVGCGDVSFGIGPRLNAAGRIVHGELVVELLTTKDSIRADKLARDLNELNGERQGIEGIVKEHAIEQIEQEIRSRIERGEDSELWGLVAWGADFHTGVIGIVAQRLVEHFYRPSVVMGMDSPGIWKGSVRGIKGFSVVKALGAVGQHLIKFGGHDGAGGFSVREEKLTDFKGAFMAECARVLKTIDREPCLDVDAEGGIEDCTIQAVRELEGLAPFGVGNPTPTVLIRGLEVREIKVLKDAHLKVIFSDGRRFITGLMWRHTEHPALIVGARVDIACRPEINSYGGNQELQATLQAVREEEA